MKDLNQSFFIPFILILCKNCKQVQITFKLQQKNSQPQELKGK